MIANARLEFDETEKALDLYDKSFQWKSQHIQKYSNMQLNL
jgi:hypothetical protein